MDLFLCALVVVLAIALVFVASKNRFALFRRNYEINQIELGIGSGKVTLKPNNVDLDVAYKLWVELMTRKLGLPYDQEHDVIVEIYDSWYEFFRLTRELVKSIPVSRIVQNESTQTLVAISIDVLNKALRPHLTKWQSKYRHWYDKELNKPENALKSPQEIQKAFPEYKSLVEDITKTNHHLVAYAKVLSDLVEPGLHSRIVPS